MEDYKRFNFIETHKGIYLSYDFKTEEGKKTLEELNARLQEYSF